MRNKAAHIAVGVGRPRCPRGERQDVALAVQMPRQAVDAEGVGEQVEKLSSVTVISGSGSRSPTPTAPASIGHCSEITAQGR